MNIEVKIRLHGLVIAIAFLSGRRYERTLYVSARYPMADRAEGFYWVIDGKGTPEVAAWSGGFWWLTGYEEVAIDAQIIGLGDCLVAPAWKDEPSPA